MANLTLPEALQLAIQHHQAGRLPQAEVLYRKVLARDPDCADALHFLGVIAHQVGRHTVAVELISRAAVLAPNDLAIHSNLGEAYRQLRRLDEAVASFRRALAIQPEYPDALNNLGNALVALNQPDDAIACFQQALALQPDYAIAHYNLGNLLKERHRVDEAVACFRQALALQPDLADAHNNLGDLLKGQGLLDQALACFQRALTLKPDLAEAHNNLGHICKERGQFDEAITACRRALALKPDFVEAHNNLGTALAATGRHEEALTCFKQALSHRPNFALAYYNLGNLYKERGQLDDAVACFRQAITLTPDHAEAHNNLGNLFKERGELDDALACFRRALALKPDYAEAHSNLGCVYRDRGQLDDALTSCQQALALRPDLAETHNNLGGVFKERGQLDEAIACFRLALSLRPDFAKAHSNIILALQYHAPDESGAIKAEHRRWNQQHAQPLAKFIQPHANDRSPDRRLRIGYVSPDFRQHPVGLNLLPLFQHHAHDQFEVFCYAHVPTPDDMTARLRACSDHWRDIVPLTDPALAEFIRQDRIDLLVDLALHTAKNRLLAFARKPAPVQVSFAGYPAGTGLEAIDYHLTDPYLEPATDSTKPGPDAPFRLPETFWCYDPQAAGQTVGPLPALAEGRLTFGSLNNFCKINDGVLHLWARVLLAVPGSRLILLTAEGSHRQRVLDPFVQAGVNPDRVVLTARQPRDKYFALHQRIDLGLDTFPYNGHTTSLDSYWMGVPVITLVGPTSVSRAGWSQLSNLGLAELAGHTPDEFVKIATDLAGDRPRLAALRAGLRERMQRSPLMDAPRFARHVEAAYRTMWLRWCGLPADGPALLR